MEHDEQPLRLRPHHLLCIAHFVGEGYSDAFSENMDRLTKQLAAKPARQIQLCSAADAVCSCCPNRIGESCSSADKVSRYDSACLCALSLREGDCLPWGTLAEQVEKLIIRPNQREKICGDCQWNSLCRQVSSDKHPAD